VCVCACVCPKLCDWLLIPHRLPPSQLSHLSSEAGRRRSRIDSRAQRGVGPSANRNACFCRINSRAQRGVKVVQHILKPISVCVCVSSINSRAQLGVGLVWHIFSPDPCAHVGLTPGAHGACVVLVLVTEDGMVRVCVSVCLFVQVLWVLPPNPTLWGWDGGFARVCVLLCMLCPIVLAVNEMLRVCLRMHA
jgi:hypothetical protein